MEAHQIDPVVQRPNGPRLGKGTTRQILAQHSPSHRIEQPVEATAVVEQKAPLVRPAITIGIACQLLRHLKQRVVGPGGIGIGDAGGIEQIDVVEEWIGSECDREGACGAPLRVGIERDLEEVS